ncbi:phosphatase, partial [Streptomyces sp. NPDC048481]
MTSAAGPAVGDGELDAEFAETVRRTGASIGALFLLEPGGGLLRLTLLCGAPAEFAAPWTHVSMTAPAPVAEAVREDRMVWVGSQEQMARSYPRTAMVLPFPLALVAAPVTGARRWGSLLLIWPASRPPYMTARERGNIASSCGRLARLLDDADAHGRSPAVGGARPRAPPRGGPPRPPPPGGPARGPPPRAPRPPRGRGARGQA